MDDRVLDIITVWAPIVISVLSIVNACTKHYTKFNGIVRIVMEIVERLSVLASKNAPRKVKMPLTSLAPDPMAERMEDVKKRLEELAKIKAAGRNPLDRRSV